MKNDHVSKHWWSGSSLLKLEFSNSQTNISKLIPLIVTSSFPWYSHKRSCSLVLIWHALNCKYHDYHRTQRQEHHKHSELPGNIPAYLEVMNHITEVSPCTYLRFQTVVSGGFRITPRSGRQPPPPIPHGGGHKHANSPNFPKNCMKLKEFSSPEKGVRPSRSLRSATGCHSK